jgi:hypothetical protein
MEPNKGNGGTIREGFIPEPRPEPPGSSTAPPLPPLPSVKTVEAPVPEPALTELERVRREIADRHEQWPITIDLLYKSIRNDKGEMVNKLVFREPRASEINKIGNPIRMLWDGEILIEERKMTYIMGALSGVLPVLLDDMDPRDWNSCALRLRKFFLPDLRGW